MKLLTESYFLQTGRQLPDPSLVKSVCIFLHGLGANGEDLISIGHQWAHSLQDTLFLSPNAPTPYGSMGGFQWFDLRGTDPVVMRQGIMHSAYVLKQYIEEILQTYALPSSKLALVGFSQGAAMALHVGLYVLPVGCIVGYSGGLFLQDNDAALLQSPVLLVHGTEDVVLPIDFLHTTNHYLQAKGAPPQTCICEGTGHWIDQNGMIQGMEFVKKHLNLSKSERRSDVNVENAW